MAYPIFEIVFSGLLIVGAYFIYKYFEPEIRFRKYINAFKIGAVVKAGKDSDIDVESYLEMRVKSLTDKIDESVAKALEKVTIEKKKK